MKRLLLFLFCLGSLLASNAQFPATNLKQNFKWGAALGTRDSTAYGANDSLVVVINRQGRMMYRSTDGYWKVLADRRFVDSADLKRIQLESGNDTIVPIPTEFGYQIPFDILRNGTTYKISPQFSLQTHANITVNKTYYVNVNTGNDANAGTSWGTALKSVSSALLRTDVDRIFVAKGVYPYADSWRNANPTRSVEIIGDLTQGVGDSVWLTSNATLTTSWTSVSNYYFARFNRTTDTAFGAVDRNFLDKYGNPIALTLRTNIADVNANPNSVFVSNDTVYIRTSDSRLPDSQIWVTAQNRSINNLNGFISNAKNYYVKNINFYRGGFYATATFGNLYAENVRIIGYANFFDGLTEVMLFNVRASQSTADLMNYDPQGLSVGSVVEYNSNFSAAALGSACGNCQVSTAHDGMSILRINSTYSGSSGQNIGDVNGTKSLIYNCTVDSSVTTKVGYFFGTGASPSFAWLENSRSTNQLVGGFDIEQGTNATIRVKNFSGSRTNSGTILAYTPNENYGSKVSEMQESNVLNSDDFLYVAKSTSPNYVSAKISASKLFENSGKLSVNGADVGATTSQQKFLQGISVNEASGATTALRSLSTTDIAFQIQALPSQTADLFRTRTSGSTVLGRGTVGGNWNFGTNAGNETSNFSATFTGGNPVIDFGGTSDAQETSLRIFSGATPWRFRYQGNLNSGRLILNRGSQEFFFNSDGTFRGRITPRSGSTGAGTAPIKFETGSLMSTPENGAFEFLDSVYYATANTTRYKIPLTLTGSFTLDFGSTAAGASTDIVITVTGAMVGNVVNLGLPSSWTAGGIYQAFVSGANSVTVRYTNASTAPIDPASATFNYIIFKNQ